MVYLELMGEAEDKFLANLLTLKGFRLEVILESIITNF